MKPYYCYMKEDDVSYLEIINDLIKNSINKFVNKEISMILDYPKL